MTEFEDDGKTIHEQGWTGRVGGIIGAVSAKRIKVIGDDIDPTQFDPLDIAHHLSNLCRFGGATREFYSVAEHCVRCAMWVKEQGGTEEEIKHALLHDASEAYLVDMPRPIKRAPGFEGYLEAEAKIEHALEKRFDLSHDTPQIVKQADIVLLVTEKRDLLPHVEDEELYWPEGVEPYRLTIQAMPPEMARWAFLGVSLELGIINEGDLIRVADYIEGGGGLA